MDDNFDSSTPGWGVDHFGKIQDGIDAVSGSTVHVAAGTYYENIVLKNGVEVLGAGNASTIIDGMQNGSVVTATNVSSTTKLDGFTVTNGSGTLVEYMLGISSIAGGGMYNNRSSSTVTNCVFENNSADSGGGIYNLNSSLTISNCTLKNNSAYEGGGMYNLNSSPALANCIFWNNTACLGMGGGVFNEGSSPTLTNCIFVSNVGTCCAEACPVDIYSGGMYTCLIGCLISGGTPIVTNCIFWDNSALGNVLDSESQISGPADVTYSDVEGGYSGVGNINASPMFANASAGDFHLTSGSPCIDVGNNSAPSIPATDFEGDPRILNGLVDMGVDEYLPPVITDLAIMSFDCTTIRLTWTTPAASGNTTVSQYEIRCSASSINEGNRASATVCSGFPNPFTPKAPGQTETFTATNLSRLSTYYFAVKSYDGSQWSNVSNCVSASTRQPRQDVGDWWLYQIYYNSEGSYNVSNTNYEIRYISAVNQPAYVNYSVITSANRRSGFQPNNSYYYSDAAVLNWITNESGSSCTNPYRNRLVATGMTGFMVPTSYPKSMQDYQLYINATDPLLWINTNSILRGCCTLDFLDGQIPTYGLYSYNDSAVPATKAWAPNGSEGYPFTVGQTWSQWVWMTSNDTYLGSSNIDQERGYRWLVDGNSSSYDVDAACEAPAATGTFYVMNVSYNMAYWRTYSGGGMTGQNNSVNASARCQYWYSEDVHNFVRQYDRLAYYGREDIGIVKYEVQDFGKSLSVTNTGHSAWPTVNMTVTNTNDYSTSFNVLLVVMNASATPYCPSYRGAPYFFSFGKTVYPNMANVSQMNQAIKNTGTLNPGQSTTVTWSNFWQVPATNGNISPELRIWCSGETYSWAP